MTPDGPPGPDGPADAPSDGPTDAPPPTGRPAAARRSVLLRLDPAVHDALARWAADDLRSVNAQIDMLLRRSLDDAGRLPRGVRPTRRPGRPPVEGDQPTDQPKSRR